MAPGGRVFITGPDVVKRATGEQIHMEGLSGPKTHWRTSHALCDHRALHR